MDEETCPICCSASIAINHDGDNEEHECLACGEIWYEEKGLGISEYSDEDEF